MEQIMNNYLSRPDDRESPLVSCICPIADRIEFVPQLINNFLRQDYQPKELIIIDNGQQELYNSILKQQNIKYIRVEPNKFTVGALRNIACILANGEIIATMDSDDIYSKDWLSKSVEHLQSTGADITGLKDLYFYNEEEQKAWEYRYSPIGDNKDWVAGATMVYRKSLWEKYPFPEINIGEDNQFCWHSGGCIVPHNYIDGFVSLLHNGNTSPKYTNDTIRWFPQDVEKIKDIISKIK